MSNYWQAANNKADDYYGFLGTPANPTSTAVGPSGAGTPGAVGVGTSSAGSGMPDYKSLIENDPLYKQLKADLSAQGVSDAAQRAAATRRGIIAFGLAPDFNSLGVDQGFLKQDVDEGTLTTAKNNPFSISKRLETAFNDSLRSLRTSLRQRGASRSGEAGFGAQRAQSAYDESKYDQLQKLLDYIGGAQQAFVTSERTRQAQMYQALLAAMQNQMMLNPGGGGDGGGYSPPQPAAGGYTPVSTAGTQTHYSSDPRVGTLVTAKNLPGGLTPTFAQQQNPYYKPTNKPKAKPGQPGFRPF